jgi:hypothetical protein
MAGGRLSPGCYNHHARALAAPCGGEGEGAPAAALGAVQSWLEVMREAKAAPDQHTHVAVLTMLLPPRASLSPEEAARQAVALWSAMADLGGLPGGGPRPSRLLNPHAVWTFPCAPHPAPRAPHAWPAA